MPADLHFSDSRLLMDLDGELPARDSKKLRRHLADCGQCRARRQELEKTIAAVSRLHRETEIELPGASGPRALLRASLERFSGPPAEPARGWIWAAALAGAAVLLLGVLAGVILARHPAGAHSAAAIPDSRLTPGAALLWSRESVCSQPNTKNRAVPVALRRQVFEAYGLSNASPRDYEVDYLITPALGGADDIHNLWPQPYSSTVWNAEVKDELEDRLRQMVCDGHLDLTEAQREIAVNWIAAYKKYFHTDRPVQRDEPR